MPPTPRSIRISASLGICLALSLGLCPICSLTKEVPILLAEHAAAAAAADDDEDGSQLVAGQEPHGGADGAGPTTDSHTDALVRRDVMTGMVKKLVRKKEKTKKTIKAIKKGVHYAKTTLKNAAKRIKMNG